MSVSECFETEDIGNQLIAIIRDDTGALLRAVCWAGIWWDNIGLKKR
jgi:hypothetical protein